MIYVPFAPGLLYRNLGNADMEGLNFILLKKRKSCFGGNKNRPNSKVRCSIPPDRPLSTGTTIPRKARRRAA